MPSADRDQISKDVVVGLFDIVTSCADVANAEPQEALDRFGSAVHGFITDGGRLTGHLSPAEAAAVIDRAETLATYAAYRYAKLTGTIAESMGVPTVDLMRQLNEKVILGTLEDGARSAGGPSFE